MALEPITRQEQIIAGKDLQPITRMEKFLKEYLGRGGGTGGGVFVVNFSTEDGVEYTSDKTFNEIENAINNGMYVYGCSQGEPGVYTFLNLEVFDTGMLIMFGATFGMMGDYYHMEMTINPDNSVESVQVALATK